MPPTSISLFQQRLLDWYRKHQRHLPWRETRDPYRIWVSEVMLQQTQVATVIDYYHRFLNRFPDISALAKAHQQSVLKLWEGLGYYARARNLHRAARLVVTDHQGRIPSDYDLFRSLPGVGGYIAAAVLSIAFDQPHAVVDGNVKRVLARLEGLDTPVNQASAHKIFQKKADRLLYQTGPGTFNQAMMEIGALVCTPRRPDCHHCPVSALCTAFRTDTVESLPHRIQRKPVPEYPVAVGVIYKKDRVLITLRPPEGLLGGLWEFPGGRLKADETPRAACLREIREEVNLDVEIIEHLAHIKHAYTHFKIRMDVFACRWTHGRVRRNGPTAHKWITINAIDTYPFPTANRKFIPLIRPRNKLHKNT
jgi:A/G-specific adenine glycosylase